MQAGCEAGGLFPQVAPGLGGTPPQENEKQGAGVQTTGHPLVRWLAPNWANAMKNMRDVRPED